MTRRILIALGSLVAITLVLFSFPAILVLEINHQEKSLSPLTTGQFPVTVNPHTKTIVEDEKVNAFFESRKSVMTAAVGTIANVGYKVFQTIAISIASAHWYQSLGAVGGRFVVITPGMRKEQVANAFGNALNWNATQKKEFLTKSPYAALPFAEGSFSPGIYTIEPGMTPLMAQAEVNDRFSEQVLAHYGTTTAQIVPLDHALTIASLIEREAGGDIDMRIISGIMWNRLFINMPLQIDATLQYIKATGAVTTNWWPLVVPADLRRKSAFNTYLHVGLPPTPIASPSIASVLAALNPVNTSCLFYFHDNAHHFHCSDTYQEHVALLKKYFGRGK
ncbi:MAG: hypothetical protein JWN18_456 [Parcubacteria group bacterium]|nr:hypothetical protein [Parcubacteria group bacterium]